MIKIINGKRYNTDTATEVATQCGGGYANDFRYWKETLYRTNKGAWFIAGEGGAASHYARRVGGNSWSAGYGISALTESEAKQWLEQADEIEALELYFGGEIDDA